MNDTLHPLLKMTDEMIADITAQRILQVNPGMKLGERISGNFVYVHEGRVVQRHIVPPPGHKEIDLKFRPPHVERPMTEITWQQVQIPFNCDFENLRFNGKAKYLHIGSACIPYRELLTLYKSGDTIYTLDDHYETCELVLTQEILDMHSYVYLHFAFSDF